MRLSALLLLPLASALIAAGPAGDVRRAGANSRPLVVIDAGHGGRDRGAQPPGVPLPEKDITLLTADALRERLLAGGRARVAMTREDDRYVGLAERVRIARGLGADLFVSIHADSAPNPLASGATIYTLSEVASDVAAARFAAQENAEVGAPGGVNVGGNSTVRAILADLTLRETVGTSADFAALLRREAGGAGVPFRDTFHRFAAFVVLKAAETPAVLLETGYLTNARDAAFLLSPEGRARIANGAARAIETHLARRRSAARLPSSR